MSAEAEFRRTMRRLAEGTLSLDLLPSQTCNDLLNALERRRAQIYAGTSGVKIVQVVQSYFVRCGKALDRNVKFDVTVIHLEGS